MYVRVRITNVSAGLGRLALQCEERCDKCNQLITVLLYSNRVVHVGVSTELLVQGNDVVAGIAEKEPHCKGPVEQLGKDEKPIAIVEM